MSFNRVSREERERGHELNINPSKLMLGRELGGRGAPSVPGGLCEGGQRGGRESTTVLGQRSQSPSPLDYLKCGALPNTPPAPHSAPLRHSTSRPPTRPPASEAQALSGRLEGPRGCVRVWKSWALHPHCPGSSQQVMFSLSFASPCEDPECFHFSNKK